MSISLFRSLPLVSGNSIDQNDIFVASGLTSSFTVVNKPGIRVSPVIQIGNVQKFFNGGGFTKSGDVVTLDFTPSAGEIVVIPGITRATISAYDQAVVINVVDPLIKEARVIIGDITDIATQQYIASDGQAGIRITLPDKDLSFGGESDWLQLAPETAGQVAGAYLPINTALYLRDIVAYSTLTAGSLTGGTSLTLDDASDFTEGDYIMVDFGTAEQEEVFIQSILGNVLTVTTLGYDHDPGDSVYHNAIGFWIKLTAPEGFGAPKNLFDIGIDVLLDQISRS